MATPADAALMMHLGAEALFVGSGIFKSEYPEKRAAAIVEAVTFYEDAGTLARISRRLGLPMTGIDMDELRPEQPTAGRETLRNGLVLAGRKVLRPVHQGAANSNLR